MSASSLPLYSGVDGVLVEDYTAANISQSIAAEIERDYDFLKCVRLE
jgi:hypothetical protein